MPTKKKQQTSTGIFDFSLLESNSEQQQDEGSFVSFPESNDFTARGIRNFARMFDRDYKETFGSLDRMNEAYAQIFKKDSGISVTTISMLKRGSRPPSNEIAYKLVNLARYLEFKGYKTFLYNHQKARSFTVGEIFDILAERLNPLDE